MTASSIPLFAFPVSTEIDAVFGPELVRVHDVEQLLLPGSDARLQVLRIELRCHRTPSFYALHVRQVPALRNK